jgi:phosphatidate cytidylyltransferase
VLKRIITALIGIPVAIYVVTRGGWIFVAAVAILAVVAWHEFARMAAKRGQNLYIVTSALPVLLLQIAAGAARPDLFLPVLTVSILGILFEGLVRHCQCGEKDWPAHTSLSACAVLYVGLLFAHVILLRAHHGPEVSVLGLTFAHGEAAVWMVLLGTWASDTFAYFFGMAFGKHKFCSVSPKKSMEGAVAGFVFSFAITAGIALNWLGVSIPASIALGLVVAFCAPVGDLVESILKRSFDIKDSGNFFPGHGGVLDRMDSLLFAAPAAYYVLLFLGA